MNEAIEALYRAANSPVPLWFSVVVAGLGVCIGILYEAWVWRKSATSYFGQPLRSAGKWYQVRQVTRD